MKKIGSLLGAALAKPKPDDKAQATRHQQDAAETAEMFDDLKSIGVYLNIFKRYGARRLELIRCREWVMSLKGATNRAKIFTASYPKFVSKQDESGEKKPSRPKSKKIGQKIPPLIKSSRGKSTLNIPSLRVPAPPQLRISSNMAVRKIVTEGDPVLRRRAANIPTAELGSAKLRRLVEDMAETMVAASGVGLAAPQVGEGIRLFVAATADGTVALANPTITKRSRKTASEEEGCLSVPGTWGVVERAATVTVNAQTMNGAKVTFVAEGMLGRVCQHEIDHLDGILFIDRAKGEVKRRR
ncbi:MAG: peptide deformylase [Patescibacteria group bacterium]|nr:peptide deformylase [Patescibacteria group bacterium]